MKHKILIEMDKGELTDRVYDLKKELDKITLTYSQIGNWIPKGKKAYSLNYDGRSGDYTFKDHFLDKKITININQLSSLVILAKLLGESGDYKVLKETE